MYVHECTVCTRAKGIIERWCTFSPKGIIKLHWTNMSNWAMNYVCIHRPLCNWHLKKWHLKKWHLKNVTQRAVPFPRHTSWGLLTVLHNQHHKNWICAKLMYFNNSCTSLACWFTLILTPGASSCRRCIWIHFLLPCAPVVSVSLWPPPKTGPSTQPLLQGSQTAAWGKGVDRGREKRQARESMYKREWVRARKHTHNREFMNNNCYLFNCSVFVLVHSIYTLYGQ